MADILKGAPVAEAINERSKKDLAELATRGIIPTIAMLRVGERGDDLAYEAGATKRCDKVGVRVKSVVLPVDVGQEELIKTVETLNTNPDVHGVLVFLPLPKHLDGEALRAALSPAKDVDGITAGSLAGVFTGSGEGFAPCTAQACIEILDYYGVDCKGKRATVVGRSLIVGKPVSMLLMAKNATVTVCHTKTADLPSETRRGDIVIAAAGKARALSSEHFSRGQTVIDVGINFMDGKMCGDVDFDACEPIAGAITPVPGGVGTVTTSVLVNHVVEAARRQNA